MALEITKIKHPLDPWILASSLRLEIAALGRSERREQAAVGFQVDERRPVEAIKASDQERRPPALDQGDQRRPDRVRPNRRAEGKRAAGLTVVGRTLTHEVPARFMQPIEDLDPLERLDPVQRRDPGLGDLDAADRPVNAPLPRTIETRSPWRADDSDEGEAGVERLGRFDRDLVSPDFAQPHHDPARWFASSSLVPARLRFDRLAALEARQKLVMRHRLREHGIVLLDRGLLLFLADGRRAVLERDDVVALLVSGSHRRLDAAIGQESAERDGRYAAAAQDEIEVGGGEAAKAPLAFDDDVTRLRLQRVNDLRAPASLAE